MRKLLFILITVFCINFPAYAVDPFLDWKTIENENLYVHYADGNKAIAERVMAIAEAAHQRLTKELNWKPRDKTHIVLSDETDFPNGFALPLFVNHTVLFLAPPTSVNTLEDFDDWMSTLIFHEYTHIVHLDKSDGSPEYLRSVFGRFPFLFPNLYQPLWVLEGLATHKETDTHRGIGRGQSTLFASMMRMEVANGVQPISHVNLPVATWPAGATRYLYGVYFMNYLAEVYGEDKLQQWVEEYSNNLFPFFINTTAGQSFDKNLTALWSDFELWLIDRFQPQIDGIEANGLKTGRKISSDAYRTDSVRVIETEAGDDVYYVRNSGYKRASLVRYRDGSSEELVDLNGSANLDLHERSGVLLTQDEFCNNYTIYRDIYRYDIEEDKLTRLTECGRYIYVSWHPDGEQIFAVHHDAMKMSLHLLDAKAQLKDVLWQAKDGEVLGQIDVSPDGKAIVASVWRKGQGWNIELFDLDERVWKKITDNSEIAAYPQFTQKGNILYSQEVDGVYNLQRYTVGSETIEQLTNVIGGAFQTSQAQEGGSIYYSGYTAEGYAIFQLDDSSTAAAVSTTAAAQCSLSSESRLEVPQYVITQHEQEEYSALSNMQPQWWFPTFLFTDQRTELGLTTSGADVLGVHQYALAASYDFELEVPAATIAYAYADRFFASVRRSNEITLNPDNSLNRISYRTQASAALAFPNYYIEHQYNLLFGLAYDLTEDGKLQPGAVPAEELEDNILGIAGLFNSADIVPLSISRNDGMSLKLVAEDSDTLGSDFSGQVYTLDWRQYIRTGKESVFALRFVQGWGTDNPKPFKLGGEGLSDNVLGVIFNGSGQRIFNNRDYALRGYNEGHQELRGRRMQLLSGEWRFPFQRIERGIMAPPVGIMQWFGGVFAEVGTAYQDSPETYYPSAGIEVTADINVFYSVSLRTRVGYAHGFDDEIGDDLVYLKIGASF